MNCGPDLTIIAHRISFLKGGTKRVCIIGALFNAQITKLPK